MNKRGISLLELLLASALLTVIAGVSITMLRNTSRGSENAQLREEVASLMKTIREELDCRATLGVTNATALPLNCAAFPTGGVTLRRQNGTAIAATGAIGRWSMRAGCNAGALVVERRVNAPAGSVSANDPMNEAYYRWVDLYEGTLGFCRSYFGAAATCGGVYNYYQGHDGTAPICCRIVTSRQNVGGGGALASCAAGEYLRSGGSGCWGVTANGFLFGSGPASRRPAGIPAAAPAGSVLVSGSTDPLTGASFTAYMPPEIGQPPGWLTECHLWNGFTPPGGIFGDTFATSMAVCCPMN